MLVINSITSQHTPFTTIASLLTTNVKMRQIAHIVTHRNRNGSLSIRIRCTLNGHPYDIATGVTIDAAHWDKRRQRVTTSEISHKQFNDEIDSTLERVSKWIADNPNGDITQLRAYISPVARENKRDNTFIDKDDFYAVYDEFLKIEGARNGWENGTLMNFIALRRDLIRFEPRLSLATLTDATLTNLVMHYTDRGLKNTSITLKFALLRWFLRWAHRQHYYDGELYETFRPKLKGGKFEHKDVLYLTLDELRTIESADLPPLYKITRDIFVFCCYTGLRLSDARALRPSNIVDGRIHVVTRKTHDNLSIELNTHSKAIIERYLLTSQPNAPIFPLYSSWSINAHLKEIGRLCRIDTPIREVWFVGNKRMEREIHKWQLLTSHCARRTFVVMALRLGISSEVITKWTGHSDLKAMKPYMAIVDELKAESMAKFDTI